MMTERLKRKSNLTVLRITLVSINGDTVPGGQGLSPQLHANRVVFAIEHQQQTRWEGVVDAAEIGLPTDVEAARRFPDTAFSLPPLVIREIEQELSYLQYFDEDEPLWLEFTDPAGSLPLMPWEQLLASASKGHSLLRLPYYSLRPVPSVGRWNIVLCASSPEAKAQFDIVGLLMDFVDAIPKALQRFATLHIFSDEPVYSSLGPNLKLGFPRLMLHNPADAARYGVAERVPGLRDTPGNVDNPWLRWIVNALEGESADVVHFLCHGYLFMGQGALAFAESPVVNKDSAWARFVGLHQLNGFLTQVGAWSVGFSSPPHNYSVTGLRLLADQISRRRPGTVFLHDVTLDPLGDQLASAYSFLYNEGLQVPMPASAMSLYCHPSRIKQIALKYSDFDQDEILNRFTLARGRTGFPLLIWPTSPTRSPGGDNLPAWVAASQRSLEQSAAGLLERRGRSETKTQAATRMSIENALSYVVNAIEGQSDFGTIRIPTP